MVATPLYEDPLYAPTIRRPASEVEVEVYEVVVNYAVAHADRADTSRSLDFLCRSYREQQVMSVTIVAKRLRPGVGEQDPAVWLTRVGFVTFMKRVSERQLELVKPRHH